jgi:RNA-directed DNA polymerase
MAFLGAYIKPYRIYIGNRSKIQFKNKLSKIATYLQQNNVILQKTAHHMVSVTNSYLGLLSHYNTYNLRHKLLFSKPPCLLYKMGYFHSNIKKIILYKNLKQQHNKYLLR